MAETFDMSGALRFDLARGQVTMGGVAARVVVPVEALALLCRELPSDQLLNFGHSLGMEVGRRVSERLGTDLEAVSSEQMVDQLGGELALMGLGSLKVEFWGQAMVLGVQDSPLVFGDGNKPVDSGDRLLAAVLESALVRVTSRAVKVVPLARLDNLARLLVCNAGVKSNVEAWLNEGCHYGEALARLNETRLSSGGAS